VKYMLDTDTASYIIKNVPKVVAKATEHKGFWCISSVVYQELMMGMLSTRIPRLEEGYEKFLRGVKVYDFGQGAATAAAELHSQNRARGHNIGDHDNQIAGHAAHLDLTLVTNNLKHFKLLSGVHVESWA